MNIKRKKVAVLGLGKSGLAAANLLKELGAKVFISEINPEIKNKDIFLTLKDKFEIELGEHSDRLLDNELIVISPGINPDIPIIKKAKELKIPVISEIELAYQNLNCKRLISITGTNGKTTVATILGEIIRRSQEKVIVAGNIGYPLSEAVKEISREHILITEISSFQLEHIQNFRAHISVILNITEDHLDRYIDMEEYIKAKSNIYKNHTKEDFTILNYDDFRLRSLKVETLAKVIYFSSKEILPQGVYLQDNEIVCNLKDKKESICNIEEIKIKGRHNLENILASVAISKLLDIETKIIREAISQFMGLEHRLEEVKKINGVTFINDSKATNIDALKKALESFSEPIILIAGGKDKKTNFILLRDIIKERVKKLILLGESKEKIKNQIGELISPYMVNDLSQAVNLAYALAEEKDIVLLSPGCSSLDMFENFEERGRVFKEAVLKLYHRKRNTDALNI